MTFQRQRQAAAERAEALLESIGAKTLPVPVDSIARQCKVAVQYITLDDEISGMSFIKNGAAVIVVNAVHHPNRQRFTLAHELAHHVLHEDYLTKNVHVDTAVLQRNEKSSEGTDVKEVEANTFAAELLMPRALLKRFGRVDANDDAKIAEIARQFKVSPTAMAIRLENIEFA
jgi:Zn-dependent peptidase ImmA (M78 family)